MNSKELCDLYKELCLDVGFEVTEEGRILRTALSNDGSSVEALESISKIGLKRDGETVILPVMLPTKEVLDKPSGSDVIFHPVTEQVSRKISPIMRYTREQISDLNQDKISWLLMAFGKLLAEGQVESPTPAQLKMYTANADFNKITLKHMTRLLNKAEFGNPKRRIFTIIAVNKTKYDGLPCRRVATTASALRYDLTMAISGQMIWGVDIPKVHCKAIIDLIDFVIPGIADGNYGYGSNNSIAPFFDSIMRCFKLVEDRIDFLVKSYGKLFLSGYPFTRSKYKWTTLLDNLGSAKSALHSQEGNVGQESEAPRGSGRNVIIMDEAGGSENTPAKSAVQEPQGGEASSSDEVTERVKYVPLSQQQQPQQQYAPQYQQQPQQQYAPQQYQHPQQAYYQQPQYTAPQQQYQQQYAPQQYQHPPVQQYAPQQQQYYQQPRGSALRGMTR